MGFDWFFDKWPWAIRSILCNDINCIKSRLFAADHSQKKNSSWQFASDFSIHSNIIMSLSLTLIHCVDIDYMHIISIKKITLFLSFFITRSLNDWGLERVYLMWNSIPIYFNCLIASYLGGFWSLKSSFQLLYYLLSFFFLGLEICRGLIPYTL